VLAQEGRKEDSKKGAGQMFSKGGRGAIDRKKKGHRGRKKTTKE